MSAFRSFALALALGFSFLIGSPVAQADTVHGNQAEAKALCEKAADYIKKEGKEKAFAQFALKDGGFQDRDLYVFVVDDKGTFVAHGVKPALIGKSGLPLVDPNGFKFVEEFIKVKDTAWVDYLWPDASDNNKVKPKSSYIIHTPDNLFVGVGYYKL